MHKITVITILESCFRRANTATPTTEQGVWLWCIFGWCRQMDTDIHCMWRDVVVDCNIEQCVSQQLLRIHHNITKEYYNTNTQKAQNIQTGYVTTGVHSFYGLHLALQSSPVDGSPDLSISCKVQLLLWGFRLVRLPSKIALMRVLRLMCPNHVRFCLRTSSINGVSPVISLSSLIGYNWRTHYIERIHKVSGPLGLTVCLIVWCRYL